MEAQLAHVANYVEMKNCVDPILNVLPFSTSSGLGLVFGLDLA